MTILDKIIAYKKTEVEEKKKAVDIKTLEKTEFFKRDTLSMVQFLVNPSKNGIIAEFKRKSPSRGFINQHSIPEEVASMYEKYGASGISVLTDSHFFGGSSVDLINTRKTVRLPILQKDFIVDEYQIIEARSTGADCILLIAAALDKKEISNLAKTAKSLGLEIILEVHDEDELKKLCPNIDIIGINNRDLKTFTISLEQSTLIAKKIDPTFVKISESGLHVPGQLFALKEEGFNGFLIGESFMKAENPGMAFKTFAEAYKKLFETA